MAGVELILGLVGGGGVASIAAVIQNARANKTTTKVESNKNAIDGFDRLTGRLETRVASAEAEAARAEMAAAAKVADALLLADEKVAKALAIANAKAAEKDQQIAELQRRLAELERPEGKPQ